MILVFKEVIFPFILSKDFSIVIFLAIKVLEFFNLSVFKFPPTLILLELVTSSVFKFSFTTIFPVLVRLIVSVFLATNLLELEILSALIFSLANILLVFVIFLLTVILSLITLPLFTKFWLDIFLAVILPLFIFSDVVRLFVKILPELSKLFVFNVIAFTFPTDDILFCTSKNPAFTFAVFFLLFKFWLVNLFFIVIFPVLSIEFVFNSKPSTTPELFRLFATFKFPLTKIFFKLLILFEDKLLLIISPEFVNSWVLIAFEEILPLLNISFVKILSLRIFPLEFILFFISKVFPWTIDVFVKFWEFIVLATNNFPLFVINWEFTLFITVIFPLLSNLWVFKFLEVISELALFVTMLELIFSFILILFEFSKLVVVKFSLETSPVFLKSFAVIFLENSFPLLKIFVFSISFALIFPEFVIFVEDNFSPVTILFKFSISLAFKLVEDTLPLFLKLPSIFKSLFVKIKFELSTFPFIVILLLACIWPEFVVFLFLIFIEFSASNLFPISVSVEDILIFPLAWVSFKYTLPFEDITTSPFVAYIGACVFTPTPSSFAIIFILPA